MSTTQNTTTNTTAADDAHKVRALVEELGDLIDDVSTWGPDDEARMLPKLHKIRAALTAALAVDDRPWEPLNGGPVHVGDEVRQDHGGITRTAVVARVDRSGDPWTAEGAIIGLLCHGTWHVRRPVQELPTEDGAVIVPADGHEYIETRAGKKSRRLTWDAECFVWYDARGTHLAGDITHGTWQVDDQ